MLILHSELYCCFFSWNVLTLDLGLVCFLISLWSLLKYLHWEAFLPRHPPHSLYPTTCFSATWLHVSLFICGPVCRPPPPQECKHHDSKVLCLVLRCRLSAWLIEGPQPIPERLNELQLMCMVNISNEQRIQDKEKINMVSSSWHIQSHKYNTLGLTPPTH